MLSACSTNLSSRRREKNPRDIFEMARLRLQAPARRPSLKEAQDPVNIHNIWEFNELKYKGRWIFLLLMKKKHLSFSSTFHCTQVLKTEIKIRLLMSYWPCNGLCGQYSVCVCVYLSVGLFLPFHGILGLTTLCHHSEHWPVFLSLLLKLL